MATTETPADLQMTKVRKPAMATLSTATRNKLSGSEFAGPDRSYPVPDRSHAANAKARAKQQLNRGHISKSEYEHIVSKANKVLGHNKLDD